MTQIFFRTFLVVIACIVTFCLSVTILAQEAPTTPAQTETPLIEASTQPLSQETPGVRQDPVAIPVYGPMPQVTQTLTGTLSNLTGRFYVAHRNGLSRVLTYAAQYSIVNANAEIGGRAARAVEFGGSVNHVSFTPVLFGGGLCTACLLPDGVSPQQRALVATAPIEASRGFTSATTEQLLRTGGSITPTTGVATALSSTSQLTSVYLTGDSDISTYTQNINATYGHEVITANQIKAVAWLELLNPMIYSSLYSSIMNEDVKPKILDIGGFKVIPSINIILTPYGAIEKRLVTYMPRESRNLGFAIGFGSDALGRQTYYLEYSSDDVGTIWGIKIGTKTATWKQTDLSAPDPCNSQMQLGIMTQVIADYLLLQDHLNIHAVFTWKTAGFVQGQPIKRAFTALFTTEWQW